MNELPFEAVPYRCDGGNLIIEFQDGAAGTELTYIAA
jgi:hypothetical protein